MTRFPSRAVALTALLLPAALFSACGHGVPVSTVPGVTPAPPSRPFGQVYELAFRQDAGQSSLSSTVAPSGRRLTGQALTDVPDGQLTFTLIGTDTFRVGGTRHLRAVYRVTNGTGRTLEHLTFVPVDTDEDSDPATTAALTPTVGSTFFSNLRTYGDTDASDRAAALSAVTGQQLSAAQGAAVIDPDATPYTLLDTAPLLPGAPTGLVLAGRASAGWRLPTALAPGGSANVTFAVDLQTESPHTDPFSFSVMIAAGDDVNTAPSLAAVPGASPRLSLSPAGPATVSGVLGDPTDPARVTGLAFALSDRETAAAELTVSAVSSDPSVATPVLSGTGSTRVLTITPQAAGQAVITVTVSDGQLSRQYVVNYAASLASSTPVTSRFHTGQSNASSAQALDDDTMVVADDELNALRVFSRSESGTALSSFDFSAALALTDAANPELDLEASARRGQRLYWLASHSNNKSGKLRVNRYRLFATDLSGQGAASTLSFVGAYDHLRSDLIAWDNAGAHGLGPKFLGLEASAGVGVIPEAADGSGFNIEGLSFAPGSATAYLGFRAPNEPPAERRAALIVPVTNFEALVTGVATQATFDAPILLDLGGRGIRELKCTDQGCLILAGPASAGGNFALYSWSGDRSDPAQYRNDLSALAADSGGSLESLVDLPGVDLRSAAADGRSIQVLSDNGDTVYYANGVIAKDADPLWQKFRSDTVILGAAQPCVVNAVSLTPAAATVVVGAAQAYAATVTTTPANCPVTLRYASTDPGRATVNPVTGVATGVTPGSAGVTLTASAGYGSAPVTSAPATLTVTGAPDFTLSLGTPSPAVVTAGAGGVASAPLTLTPSNGYSGAPTFTVNSSPAGVTGSVTGGTLTLTVPGTLAAGAYSVSVTATDGALSRTSNAVTLTVQPPAPVPNVVIYRVGTGAAALSGVGTAVFLDTFKTDTGALLGSWAMPTAPNGLNAALVASGTATSEGLLSRSADGRYLLVAGYGAAAGTASVSSTAASSVPRVIGRVDASGQVDTSTALTDAASSNNVRSATSPDGQTLYVTGGAGGVRVTTLGSTTSTQLSATAVNLRQVNLFAGQLYVTTSSGSAMRLGAVGVGSPTGAGQTITNLPGFPTTGSPYAFYFTKLGTGQTAVDTVYVADDTANTGGIQKYSFDGASWTARGTVAAGGGEAVRGLTGVTSSGTVTLFATTATRLLSLTDAAGTTGTLSGAPTVLATASVNTAFRGVALAPHP